jgi:23S rRNA pseudouridine2605 synthase
MERLQKILAHSGLGSRRAVEQMIREGRITVDGHVAKLGERADLEIHSIKVDDRRVRPSTKTRRYVLLNKPSGYVSTVSDPEGRPVVLDLLPARLRRGLVPVGRLDYATEGLLLLTDDGDFAQHVAHPRYGCWKTYEVKVKGRPSEELIEKLRNGILIDGKRTAPAKINRRGGRQMGARESVDNSWWVVVLVEGRSRQIREMFFRGGHPVSRLRRIAVGPIAAPELPRGGWRHLEVDEIEALRKRTAKKKKRKRP